MNAALVLNRILSNLKKDVYFNGMVTAEEIDGFHFSAVDIALTEGKNKVHVFRLMVVKHDE